HVIWPFERHSGAAITGLDTLQHALGEDCAKCLGERDAGNKAESCNHIGIGVGNYQQARGKISGRRLPGASAPPPPCGLLKSCKPDAARITRGSRRECFSVGRANLVETGSAISRGPGLGPKCEVCHLEQASRSSL